MSDSALGDLKEFGDFARQCWHVVALLPVNVLLEKFDGGLELFDHLGAAAGDIVDLVSVVRFDVQLRT